MKLLKKSLKSFRYLAKFHSKKKSFVFLGDIFILLKLRRRQKKKNKPQLISNG